jgi:sec-independent protein translocase protein TatA
MGTFSIWHWLIVLAVVLVLFGGKGKISSLMGDFGKGLKSFKKGMKEDEVTDSGTDPEKPQIVNAEAAPDVAPEAAPGAAPEAAAGEAPKKDQAANG